MKKPSKKEEMNEESFAAEDIISPAGFEETPAFDEEFEEGLNDDPFEETGENDEVISDSTSQELEEVKDRYIHLLAEYDNFRRRTQKERESLYTEAAADVTKEWLLVMDNVDRALACTPEEGNQSAMKVYEGLSMIRKQGADVLAKLGVEEIAAERGGQFDPNLHAAVTHIEDDSLEEQCIAQVFLKGYKKGDRIIRHTLVQVAN